MLAVVRLARRLSTGHEPGEFASGTCRAYSWLTASPQRHSAQSLKGLGSSMASSARRLLDSLASQASVLANDIADLEQREADIRLQLDTARALQSELHGTADVLNRQRLG